MVQVVNTSIHQVKTTPETNEYPRKIVGWFLGSVRFVMWEILSSRTGILMKTWATGIARQLPFFGIHEDDPTTGR